jgi:putative DNA primase/helicase
MSLTPREVDQAVVQECLGANVLGDGTLFAHMFHGQATYNKSAQEWLVWSGHSWERDILGRVPAAVESVAIRYGLVVEDLDQQISLAGAEGRADDQKFLIKRKKDVLGRVSRLRTVAGRCNALEFAHSLPTTGSLAIRGDELDQDPWLLAFKNGVMDLRTGMFRPGLPTDLISKCCSVEWHGYDLPCPTWDQFLWESIEDEAVIAFLMRFAGYCLTGIVQEQKFVLMTGEGRNGKGVFVETLMEIMGDLAGPIQSEMLLDQGRSKSSSGPSPDIMSLFGRRLAIASESDEGRRFSPSRVKWFTGADSLVGRYPHDKYERVFRPSHKFIGLTNNPPYAPADDFAFWERLLEVNWPFQFVEHPRGEKQKQRIANLRVTLAAELPAIAARLVRGCIEWQRSGLCPPPAVLKASEEYRRENDMVQDYIEARCWVPERSADVRTSATDVYLDFVVWFKEFHRGKEPSINWFGRRLSKKFKKIKDGVYFYEGIGLLAE